MARLYWDKSQIRAQSQGEFDPAGYREALARLADVTGARLRLEREGTAPRLPNPHFAVRMGGRRTGWQVTAEGISEQSRQAAAAAADMIGKMYTADQDIASLAMEVADRYEELNFLYEMGDRVGALLDEDEICAFVVEEAAWLMDCERASIMIADSETGELKIRGSVGIPEEVSTDISVKPGERISGKVFESGHGIIVNEGDPMPAETLNVDELQQSNCFLSVPLKISSESSGKEYVLGVFNLTRKRGGSMFTASDLKLVSAVAATTATQIHNCRLINAERERQQLEHELELAARIQLSLLPEKPLRIGFFDVGGHCKPARHVGGDLFDYWVQDDRLCLVVADVSGHDMGAALMATAFRSVMRSEAVHGRSVAELMAQVNRAFYEDLVHSELFISAFYAEVSLGDGVLSYCRAGHPKPLLMQADAREWLDTEGLLIGLAEDGQFEQRSLRLSAGDMVVLYTDGLVEAHSEEGAQFGTEGIRDASMRCAALPAREMAHGVIEAARQHSGSQPLTDDMTALVVRFGEAEEG